MMVALLKDVRGTGRAGDIVTVPDGYGRNYLIPHRLAEPATSQLIEQARAQALKKRGNEQKSLAQLNRLKQQLEQQELVFHASAAPNGHLYGSISPADISHVLARRGLHVAQDTIEIPYPIDSIGTHVVTVVVGPNDRSKLRIVVERSDET